MKLEFSEIINNLTFAPIQPALWVCEQAFFAMGKVARNIKCAWTNPSQRFYV